MKGCEWWMVCDEDGAGKEDGMYCDEVKRNAGEDLERIDADGDDDDDVCVSGVDFR